MKGNNTMQLTDIRAQIDGIDDQITALLIKRMDCSKQVAAIKKAQGLPIQNIAREDEIMRKATKKSGEYAPYISGIYRDILKVSRKLQEDMG